MENMIKTKSEKIKKAKTTKDTTKHAPAGRVLSVWLWNFVGKHMPTYVY